MVKPIGREKLTSSHGGGSDSTTPHLLLLLLLLLSPSLPLSFPMKLLIAAAIATENLFGSDMTAPTLSGNVAAFSSPAVLQNGLLLPARPPLPPCEGSDDDHGYFRCGAC